MDNRRIGNFVIDQYVVEKDPEAVLEIMGQCIIVRCEYKYGIGKFYYTAISNLFEDIPISNIPPDYDISFNKETQTITVTRLP